MTEFSGKDMLKDLIAKVGGNRNLVLVLLQDLGITGVNAETISRIRGQDTSGVLIEHLIECAYVLKEGSAAAKNNTYLNIIETGLRLRRRQTRYNHRWNSLNFTASIAQELGIRDQAVRQALRGVRADFVVYSQSSPEAYKIASSALLSYARQYLDDYLTPDNVNVSPLIRDLGQHWDGESVVGFYKHFHKSGKRFISTWTPYEAEVIREFYRIQQNMGSPLTPFDKEVLAAEVSREPVPQVIKRLRMSTTINVDENVVSIHAHVLTGKPLQTYKP